MCASAAIASVVAQHFVKDCSMLDVVFGSGNGNITFQCFQPLFLSSFHAGVSVRVKRLARSCMYPFHNTLAVRSHLVNIVRATANESCSPRTTQVSQMQHHVLGIFNWIVVVITMEQLQPIHPSTSP